MFVMWELRMWIMIFSSVIVKLVGETKVNEGVRVYL